MTKNEATKVEAVPAPIVKLSGIKHLGMERVGLDQIRSDPRWNVRQELSDVPGLAEDMRQRGIMTPLLAVRGEAKGTYRLVAGFRRIAALTEIAKSGKPGLVDLASIPINVVEGNEPDLLLLNLAENEARRDLKPWEVGDRCLLLRKQYSLTAPQIAAQIPGGKSPETVGNWMRASEKLIPEWAAKWRGGQMPTREAQTMSAQDVVTQREAYEKLVASEKAPGTPPAGAKIRGRGRGDVEALRSTLVAARSGEPRIKGAIEALTWVLGNGGFTLSPVPNDAIGKILGALNATKGRNSKAAKAAKAAKGNPAKGKQAKGAK